MGMLNPVKLTSLPLLTAHAMSSFLAQEIMMRSLITDIHVPRMLRADGLHRRIHENLYSEVVVDALCSLSSAAKSTPIQLGGLLDEVSDVVSGVERPIDEHIRQYLLNTDPDHVKLSLSRGDRGIRNRVAVNTHITTRGNLSVTIYPEMLTKEGRFEIAPEWKPTPFPSYAEVTQRPQNEILFIRNMERWLRPYQHDDPAQAAVRNAACSAINMAFWLTINRLAKVFNVSYRSYLAGVADTPQSYVPDDGKHVGLEIVDAPLEARMNLEESLRGFEAVAGHTPTAFYRACNATEGWRRFEAASRTLRKTPGSDHLTPKIVENFGVLLERAKLYGVWAPEEEIDL